MYVTPLIRVKWGNSGTKNHQTKTTDWYKKMCSQCLRNLQQLQHWHRVIRATLTEPRICIPSWSSTPSKCNNLTAQKEGEWRRQAKSKYRGETTFQSKIKISFNLSCPVERFENLSWFVFPQCVGQSSCCHYGKCSSVWLPNTSLQDTSRWFPPHVTVVLCMNGVFHRVSLWVINISHLTAGT